MITISIDPVILNIGHFALRWHSLILLTAIGVGIWLTAILFGLWMLKDFFLPDLGWRLLVRP